MSSENQLFTQALQVVPLLITESKDQYEEIHGGFVREIAPSGIVERQYVDDICYLSWDIRLRRCKAALINLSFRKALEKILNELMRHLSSDLDFDRLEANTLAYDWFHSQDERRKVLKLLDQFHLDETAIEAEAIRNCAPDLALLEKLLASLESRRNRTLRNIAEYRADLGLKLRAASDCIIEGEVLLVEQDAAKEPPAAA
jgi:hypothetical protein